MRETGWQTDKVVRSHPEVTKDMKKSIILLLVLLLCVTCFAGCREKEDPAFHAEDPITGTDEDETGSGRVYFDTVKYDPDSGMLYYVIINDSDETVTVGGDVILKKKTIDGLWADVMPLTWNGGSGVDRVITALRDIAPGGVFEEEIDIQGIFGELKEGEYRIVIQIGTTEGSEAITGGFALYPRI